MGAFRLARSAAYQNDQSWMYLRLPRERQEVITVAADENPSLRASTAKDFFTECGNRQRRIQARSVVSPVLQEISDLRRDIMVEQELHGI